MTRQAVWIGVGALAALVLALAWFLANFEQVPVTRREAAAPEARRNPYLALERFLARMGREPVRMPRLDALDGLGAGDVLILDRNRRRVLDGAQGRRLLAWVEGGGHLIVAAELPGVDDPLAQALGVEWAPVAAECRADDAAPGRAGPGTAEEPAAITAQLPGAERPLALDAGFLGLRTVQGEPAWQAAGMGSGAMLLHFARGDGQVTVLADLARLADNLRIGRRDHAEILWALLRHYRPEGRVWLATRLEIPTLGQWLAESAWMVLVSASLLLAAWLAHVVPRFGGLAPAAAAERRSLRDHLAAMGRFLAASGGLTFLLETVRGALQARLALRHPALVALPPAERRKALARIARLPAEELRHALEATPRGRGGFTEAIAALQQLEQRL
jgi:hypothetical protein